MEKLSTIIANIADGAWLENLTEEQTSILQSWFSAMHLGSDKYPNLILTLRLDSAENVLPAVIFTCDTNETNGKFNLKIPGYVDWIDLDEEIPDAYMESPMIDISTITSLIEYNKRMSE